MVDRDSGETFASSWRITFLWFTFLAIIGILVVRLFSLQVFMGSSYRAKAYQVSQRVTAIPPQRGEIYDRTFSSPLVVNADSFALDIVPADIPADRRDEVFQKVAALVGKSVDDIRSKVPPTYYHLYQPIEVAGQVPFDTISLIAQKMDEYPGVTWHDKPIRNYLQTGSLSHIIGYVGDINREELQVLYNQGYQAGEVIGKSGVEKQYDSVLRGKEGYEAKTVDVKGRGVEDRASVVQQPEAGKNLVLTIDDKIQELAEKALGPRMGAVVVEKPASGEILAMVSYPWYDPNAISGEGGSQAYVAMMNDTKTPLINRAIQSSYPPASTFKIIMSSAILEEKAFPPDKKVDCQGEMTYGDRVFRCWIRKPGHGPLDLSGALAQSCDVYFWTVAKDSLGVDKMAAYAQDFGFGSLAGIDLPGETSGFIPTPQWKERRFHEKWQGGDTLNMAIGQGYTLVSPLQMADMVSEVVNDGVIYKPHILKEVRDPQTGAIIQRTDRSEIHHSSISPETFKTVRDNMRGVITHGTAVYPLNIKAVAIAGKTGTGEVGIADHWHSWFASYAPYEYSTPEDVVVVSVLVEASNNWEWWAPYASAIIYQGIFANQSYDEAVKSLGLQYLTANGGGRRD